MAITSVVDIKVDETAIRARVDSQWETILPQLSSEILYDCNEYCKEDTGALKMSALLHSKLNEGILIWRTPYARRQYWEIRKAYKTKNPNATWKWCQAAERACKDRWAKQAKLLMGVR